MKIAPDEIRGPRPNSIFASCRDASNPFLPAPQCSCESPDRIGRPKLQPVYQATEGASFAKIDVTADFGVTITGHQNGRSRHPFDSSPF